MVVVPPEFSTAHLKHVPRRFYGRWLTATLVLGVFLWIVHAFATGQIEWKVVGQFLTAKAILAGLENTIIMTDNSPASVVHPGWTLGCFK